MNVIQITYIFPKPWVVYAYDGLVKIIIDSLNFSFKKTLIVDRLILKGYIVVAKYLH